MYHRIMRKTIVKSIKVQAKSLGTTIRLGPLDIQYNTMFSGLVNLPAAFHMFMEATMGVLIAMTYSTLWTLIHFPSSCEHNLIFSPTVHTLVPCCKAAVECL